MDDAAMKKLVLWLAGFRLRHAEEWEQNRQEFRQIAENMFHAKDQPEADSYPDHPGRKGGGSLPRGASPADMRKRARENPNVRNGLDGDRMDGHIVGPMKRDKLLSHFNKHGAALGYRNAGEYHKAILTFLSQPLTEAMEELLRPDGSILRFDHQTGRIGAISPDGSAATMFHVEKQYKKSTVAYLEEKINEDRKRGNP